MATEIKYGGQCFCNADGLVIGSKSKMNKVRWAELLFVVKTFNFLGSILHRNYSSEEDIKEHVSKASRALGTIKTYFQ